MKTQEQVYLSDEVQQIYYTFGHTHASLCKINSQTVTKCSYLDQIDSHAYSEVLKGSI